MTEEKKKRGFACMSPEARSALASKGGKAAQAKGTGHKFTSEEAREAGRKGGKAAHSKRLDTPIALVPTGKDLSENAENVLPRRFA